MDLESAVNSDPRRNLPSVDRLVKESRARNPDLADWALLVASRHVVEAARQRISPRGTSEKNNEICTDGQEEILMADLLTRVEDEANRLTARHPRLVINATGVLLHTNMGRAPLSEAAQAAVAEAARGYSNLELDLETGRRGSRTGQLESKLVALSGAEAAHVVNNNAAAVLLALNTIALGRSVIVSRGELIVIGGSFRLPDVMKAGGAILKEVGTTNRTRVSDYEKAIGPETAAIMVVHPSNYRVVGFAETPGISELVPLARAHNLIAIDDIGSGSLIDVTKYGLPAEPTFMESIAADADVVLGSGDKLLGGPQAGCILGKTESVKRIRQHPLARAVRVGKLTLAALSATLDSYLRGTAEQEIPTIRMLAATLDKLRERAAAIRQDVDEAGPLQVDVREDRAPVGGGSLPGADLPTAVLALSHAELSADELAQRLRVGTIRIFARIQHDQVLIDLRSVQPDDDSKIGAALRRLVSQRDNQQ